MSTELTLPDLGENIASGDVVKVLVAIGETLVEDQPVIELETDKAVIEVPSSITGTITEILIQPGETLAIGQAILKVAASAAPQLTVEPPVAATATVATSQFDSCVMSSISVLAVNEGGVSSVTVTVKVSVSLLKSLESPCAEQDEQQHQD